MTPILPTPDGLVTVRIDRSTGLRTDGSEGEFEMFRLEHAPKPASKNSDSNNSHLEIY
jgi:hypothetical protein